MGSLGGDKDAAGSSASTSGETSDSTSAAAETLKASRRWFDRLRKGADLSNVRLQGEAASDDSAAVAAFPEQLQKIIEEGGYSPKQVFNIHETGLYSKNMPTKLEAVYAFSTSVMRVINVL